MWPKIVAGKSGVRRLDDDSLSVPLGATPDYAAVRKFGEMDLCSGLALVAANEALRDAGLSREAIRSMDVIFGTSKGGIRTFEAANRLLLSRSRTSANPATSAVPLSRERAEYPQEAERRHDADAPLSFLGDFLTNSACDRIARHFHCRGAKLNFVSACATGTHSILMAARRVARGKAKAVIAGSSEASLTPLIVAAFDKMGVLSHRTDEPAAAVRPYDARRDGFAIGEGSGALVIESLESALSRGARIRAEITGWALSGEAYHIASMDPSGESVASTIRLALEKAGLSPKDLDYINSHGTATRQNDVAETRAFKLALGKHAYDIPISSTKPMTGHLLGATGSVEAIITILAIENGFVPPTINLTEPDPECDLNYTPQVGLRRQIEHALTLNYGFGGQIAALILSEFRP